MSAALTAALSEALATEGLVWLVVAVFIAGVVRGFSGFGTAMIYMPVAGTILSPVWALITILVFDLFGPLPNVPRALRDGMPKQVLRLGLGALITLPIGIFLLTRLDPEIFRWMVSILALVLLALLLTGWRYSKEATPLITSLIGAAGGFMGGISGIAGPPVILFYMSSRNAVAAIRGNILLYLLFVDVLALAIFGFSGLLNLVPVMIGVVLTLPYTIGNMMGAAVFNPDKEKLYRWIAYVIIAVSAIRGLPLFG